MQQVDLYHPVILELGKNPFHFNKMENADMIIEAYNPFCGDKYSLFLRGGGRIEDASFYGYGCAVSKASASLLTEIIIGKSHEEISGIISDFISFVNGDDAIVPVDQRLLPFALAQKYPARVQCAVLAWEGVLKRIP